MKVELTRITGDPVLAIEEAACNCYDSEPTVDGKILKHCVDSGHTSVTEFCNFTFHVEGVSRALLAQLTRHRHAGYAVRSQRYCVEDNFGYVIPKSIDNKTLGKDIYNNLMQSIQDTYNGLIKLGVSAEDARMVLPNACETTLEVTMNLRALMNFMNERLCTCAQWEIRKLAQEMKRLIVKQVPLFDNYLVPKCEKSKVKYCPESAKRTCGKHPLAKDINFIIENYMDNLLEYRGYYGVAFVSPDDKILWGRIIGTDDLILFEGENYNELVKDFHNVVDDYIDFCKRSLNEQS